MRNPDRIEPFLSEIGQLWKEKYPDWRFGQLMFNFFSEMGDPFYLEEEEFMESFKCFMNDGNGDDIQLAIMEVFKKKLEESDAQFKGEGNIRKKKLDEQIKEAPTRNE